MVAAVVVVVVRLVVVVVVLLARRGRGMGMVLLNTVAAGIALGENRGVGICGIGGGRGE